MSGKGEKIVGKLKAASSTCKDRSEGKRNGRILCYVCGGNGANWSLYSKENDGERSPYFPFLQSIEKAEGAQPMRSNGRIDACTLCFSFLVQQWHSYEENDTPISKRTYWLKRSGVVNNETSHLNEDKFSINDSYSLAGKSHETIESSVKSESVNDENNLEHNCSDLRGLDLKGKRDINKKESSDELLTMSENESKHEQGEEKSRNIQMTAVDKEIEDTCCSCGKQGGSAIFKTVHTKPQLKTETPFYPFLAQCSPKHDFTGKVTVCKSCEVLLFKQWEQYEKLHTPLSERYYTLLSASNAENETKSDLFVCFVCGEKEARTLAKDVRATKGNSQVPYFPFLLRHLLPAGATEITEAGAVKVCKLCHESLTNQWNTFEEDGLGIHKRHYQIKRDDILKNKNDGNSDDVLNYGMHTCSVCQKLMPGDQINFICNKDENTIVPFNRSPVCLDCKKTVKHNSETSTHSKPVASFQKLYSETDSPRMLKDNGSPVVPKSQSLNESLHVEICFLCGEKVNAFNLEYLYVFPRQYMHGFKPFFPSLAYRVPAYRAKPPSASGTVITCTYCHGNMLNQWYECDNLNPWVRQYVFNQFTCYLCSKSFPRQKITAVSSSDFPFLSKVRRPPKGFRINNQKDYTVCQHCSEIIHVQKENFDKCNVDASERDYELPMVQLDSELPNKPLKRKSSESQSESSHPIVVIGDSEPEGDEGEVWKRDDKKSVSNVVTSSRTSASAESLHVGIAHTSSAGPMSSSVSGEQNSSFAAALRKLAKQAMSPGSQSPVSVLQPPSNSTMSPVKSNGCESPKLNGIQTVCKKEVSDPSYMTSKENRIHPNLTSSSELPGISGHQVVPGVFSLGPRGFENKGGTIEDLHAGGRVQDIPRVRAMPPPPQSHPFYMPFLQRPAVPDSMYLPPFPYYPPTMMDAPGLLPPGFDHEAWRKRRALEHMRQQHERHAQFFSPHERPMYIMEQDHHKPLSVQASMGQRPFPGDLPPRGEKNLGKSSPRLEPSTPSDSRSSTSTMPKETVKTPEVLGSRSPRGEQLPVTSSLMRQSGSSTTPVIISNPHSPSGHQTSLRSPSKEGGIPHVNEREGENIKDSKQREHQIVWTRRMFEQKRRLRQEEIEWQHRQQQVRQQKREVQQELFQFRQKLLQQKELEKDENSKEQDRTEQKDDGNEDKSKDGQRVSPENKMGLAQYGYPPVYHDTHQPMHSMFGHPRLPHHEIFYPPGYLPQAPIPHRMDTRMYKEYLQQPSHFMHDNKTVSEWLEKQRNPENFLGEGRDRFINGEVSKDKHEPQKLKFMKDLGLMTVMDKRERPQTMLIGGKRKFSEETIRDESNKENRVENGDVSAETGAKKANVIEEDTDKKIEFLLNLGLVTHRKRQELEDDFEKNRWERRQQRLQRKTKKTKKEKKEEKSRSRTPLDLDVSGPMTRQKQQLLQEYGLLLPIKDAMEKESSSSPDSSATADRDSVKGKDSPGGQAKKSKKCESPTKAADNEDTFRPTYEVSTPPPRPTTSSTSLSSGPQLTLQSLTHMENPYRTFQSAFHPPYYHSGLLSVHQDPTGKDPRRSSTESSAPSRAGSKTYPAIVPGNIGVYRGNGAETRPSWMLTEEPLKWPGTSKVVQSYLTYHKEQENELNISKERKKKLKLENSTLSEESERLNTTYSELMISKQKLEADQQILNGKLERLRNFMVLVQNR